MGVANYLIGRDGVGVTKSLIGEPCWCVFSRESRGPMPREDGTCVKVRGRRARKRRRKASNEGEKVAIVAPLRSVSILLLWTAGAISWCHPLVCSRSGC